MSDNTTETNTTYDATANVISIVDLQNLLVVFDLASSRGAFRGTELSQIGQLYDKVDRFVKSVLPKATEETDSPSTTEGA